MYMCLFDMYICTCAVCNEVIFTCFFIQLFIAIKHLFLHQLQLKLQLQLPLAALLVIPLYHLAPPLQVLHTAQATVDPQVCDFVKITRF